MQVQSCTIKNLKSGETFLLELSNPFDNREIKLSLILSKYDVEVQHEFKASNLGVTATLIAHAIDPDFETADMQMVLSWLKVMVEG